MVRGTLPVPPLPPGNTAELASSDLSHSGEKKVMFECSASPAVWDAAGETRFSPVARRVLRWGVHNWGEGDQER